MTNEEKLAKFGPGPWMDEPDRIEWRVDGIPCLMVRNESGGNWCGYAGVAPGHPWHGKEYGDLDGGIDVHGGLTYAEACAGHICHVPEPGEPDHVWWLGFDCAHHSDLAPGHRFGVGIRPFAWESYRKSYRNVDYVRREVESLAAQVRDAAVKP